ncbi:hypothetical protein KG112_16430 [Nocardioides sp. zg-ZUI104]|uniref:hypothetical protein n=1 Tax=Nocardioides faecalis TaxID=2803858 RepID=UPI001BCBE047|nr:hypothetical protein [Nocardioides faecalis]MBS4754396.1 hypothetical protein [Nocardioides faecalis]
MSEVRVPLEGVRRLRRPPADLLVATTLALLVTAPLLLGRGFWLVGDMVFVPAQPWKPAWLGLDGALPRAVPMDALMSVLTTVVPGDLVQKAVVLGGLVLGGLGVGRLVARSVPGQTWYARAAAITLFCWNPWVYERLLIGQWAILLGYLLLPWVALAALRLRRDPRDWAPAALTLTCSAVCSPSSGLMAAGVLAVLALGREWGAWWRAALLVVVANLTWAVPAVTADAARVSTDGVFAGFAARAESSAGAFASVLSLGGIWKSSIVPAERTDAVLVVLSCLLSIAALLGWWRAGRGRSRWLALGAVALLLALVPVPAAGAALLEAAGERVPGLALLRDSHRFLAPLGLVLAVGSAHAVVALRAWVTPATRSLWGAVVLLVVAPLLLLPSLAWGAFGELQRSTYPAEWDTVAGLVGDEDLTVVLPWRGLYRGYDFNHRRAVLDPAPRYLPGQVLIDDRLLLEDREVPAEDPRVRAVDGALAAAEPAQALRALGVRWVLLEKGMVSARVPQGSVVHDGPLLRLVDLADGGEVASGPTAARPDVGAGQILLVGLANFLAILLLLSAIPVILHTRSNGCHTT